MAIHDLTHSYLRFSWTVSYFPKHEFIGVTGLIKRAGLLEFKRVNRDNISWQHAETPAGECYLQMTNQPNPGQKSKLHSKKNRYDIKSPPLFTGHRYPSQWRVALESKHFVLDNRAASE